MRTCVRACMRVCVNNLQIMLSTVIHMEVYYPLVTVKLDSELGESFRMQISFQKLVPFLLAKYFTHGDSTTIPQEGRMVVQKDRFGLQNKPRYTTMKAKLCKYS